MPECSPRHPSNGSLPLLVSISQILGAPHANSLFWAVMKKEELEKWIIAAGNLDLTRQRVYEPSPALMEIEGLKK
jgi:hypothetical protein